MGLPYIKQYYEEWRGTHDKSEEDKKQHDRAVEKLNDSATPEERRLMEKVAHELHLPEYSAFGESTRRIGLTRSISLTTLQATTRKWSHNSATSPFGPSFGRSRPCLRSSMITSSCGVMPSRFVTMCSGPLARGWRVSGLG